MRIRSQQVLWAAGFVAAAGLAQSTIQSAIHQSTIQSAIRNPQSAISPSPWRSLFDGASLKEWRGYKADAVPAGWKIDHGTLAKDARVADIVSKDEFGDFELEIDWRIGEAGNSGIDRKSVVEGKGEE